MRNKLPTYAARAPLAAHVAPRVSPRATADAQSVADMLCDHSTRLQDAADATVAAVLKANLPPAAFAVLEEFRKDFDKASEGVGNSPLLLALEHLSEPDTQEVLCATLARLMRQP
jgi:hypothetical protein